MNRWIHLWMMLVAAGVFVVAWAAVTPGQQVLVSAIGGYMVGTGAGLTYLESRR